VLHLLSATILFGFGAGTAWLGLGLVQVLAFLGGLGTVLGVYAIARSSGRAAIVTLLLTGYAVSSVLAAGTAVLITHLRGNGPRKDLGLM
jgi:iron complex transport system permease protein